MRVKVLLLLVCMYVANLYGQIAGKNQFDFFVGNWEIEQSILSEDGKWLKFEAETIVEKQLNGKILTENWKGKVQFFWANMEKPRIIQGYSLRYFDENSGEWKIYWMDDLNPGLSEPFKGNFIDKNQGIFYKISEEFSRKIIFTIVNENRILWELFISTDRENWRKLWVMEMQRNPNPKQNNFD